MDLKTQTLEQLKALAYDQLLVLNQTQNNIKLIEQEITIRHDRHITTTTKDSTNDDVVLTEM